MGVGGARLTLRHMAADTSCKCSEQLTRAVRAFPVVFKAVGSSYRLQNASESADAATVSACCRSTKEIWRITLVMRGGKVANYVQAYDWKIIFLFEKGITHDRSAFCCQRDSEVFTCSNWAHA